MNLFQESIDQFNRGELGKAELGFKSCLATSIQIADFELAELCANQLSKMGKKGDLIFWPIAEAIWKCRSSELLALWTKNLERLEESDLELAIHLVLKEKDGPSLAIALEHFWQSQHLSTISYPNEGLTPKIQEWIEQFSPKHFLNFKKKGSYVSRIKFLLEDGYFEHYQARQNLMRDFPQSTEWERELLPWKGKLNFEKKQLLVQPLRPLQSLSPEEEERVNWVRRWIFLQIKEKFRSTQDLREQLDLLAFFTFLDEPRLVLDLVGTMGSEIPEEIVEIQLKALRSIQK